MTMGAAPSSAKHTIFLLTLPIGRYMHRIYPWLFDHFGSDRCSDEYHQTIPGLAWTDSALRIGSIAATSGAIPKPRWVMNVCQRRLREE